MKMKSEFNYEGTKVHAHVPSVHILELDIIKIIKTNIFFNFVFYYHIKY